MCARTPRDALYHPAVRLRVIATVALLLLGAGVLAAGCTGRPARPSGSAVASCPTVTGSGFSWPAGIPATLPIPPGARLETVRQLASGFTLVTLRTAGAVRDNLLRFTAALQAAGYTVGRGVVGASQSRLPFTCDGRPGVLQLTAIDACATRWELQA
jgi:hypothetical protein